MQADPRWISSIAQSKAWKRELKTFLAGVAMPPMVDTRQKRPLRQRPTHSLQAWGGISSKVFAPGSLPSKQRDMGVRHSRPYHPWAVQIIKNTAASRLVTLLPQPLSLLRIKTQDPISASF